MTEDDRNKWLHILDKLLFILKWASKIFDISALIVPVAYGLYSASRAASTNEAIAKVFVGFFISFVIAIFLVATHVSVWTVGKISDKLTLGLRKRPQVRWIIILVFAAVGFIATPMYLLYADLDYLLTTVLYVLLGLLLPSTLFSIVGDDIQANKGVLPNYNITKDLVLKNPQAAIENAFTVFEDTLRRKAELGSHAYGESLINQAFGKDKILTYGDVEGENTGVRNLLSGMYATFRNPRKHRIVKDDEITALRIIALIELALQIVESADKRVSPES